MQAIPRFVSTPRDSSDACEFLHEAPPDHGDQLTRIFFKCYPWPFDVRKARDGWSVIDLLVYRKTVLRGRRMFLDFRTNSMARPLDPQRVGHRGTRPSRPRGSPRPARGAGTGVDVETDMLEIPVCAQHNNGVVEAAQRLLVDATARADAAQDTTDVMLGSCTPLMGDRATFVRTPDGVRAARDQVRRWLADHHTAVVTHPAGRRSINLLFLIRDILASHYDYLEAMLDYGDHGGRSRGTVLYTDPGGHLPRTPDGSDIDLPED